jgi:hypothetical protein
MRATKPLITRRPTRSNRNIATTAVALISEAKQFAPGTVSSAHTLQKRTVTSGAMGSTSENIPLSPSHFRVIQITALSLSECDPWRNKPLWGEPMDERKLLSGVEKLAVAGQQAGFSIEQMIGLLSAGMAVETLLDLISWRIEQPQPMVPVLSSSHWVV